MTPEVMRSALDVSAVESGKAPDIVYMQVTHARPPPFSQSDHLVQQFRTRLGITTLFTSIPFLPHHLRRPSTALCTAATFPVIVTNAFPPSAIAGESDHWTFAAFTARRRLRSGWRRRRIDDARRSSTSTLDAPLIAGKYRSCRLGMTKESITESATRRCRRHRGLPARDVAAHHHHVLTGADGARSTGPRRRPSHRSQLRKPDAMLVSSIKPENLSPFLATIST